VEEFLKFQASQEARRAYSALGRLRNWLMEDVAWMAPGDWDWGSKREQPSSMLLAGP
jgi:hypothetical protein